MSDILMLRTLLAFLAGSILGPIVKVLQHLLPNLIIWVAHDCSPIGSLTRTRPVSRASDADSFNFRNLSPVKRSFAIDCSTDNRMAAIASCSGTGGTATEIGWTKFLFKDGTPVEFRKSFKAQTREKIVHKTWVVAMEILDE